MNSFIHFFFRPRGIHLTMLWTLLTFMISVTSALFAEQVIAESTTAPKDRLDVEDRKGELDLQRLEAELRKLQLEAQEIQARVNLPWYEAELLKYFVAILIAAGVLLLFFQDVVKPIWDKKIELGEVQESINKHRTELLAQENQKITVEKEKIQQQNKQLEDDRQQLRIESGRRYADLYERHVQLITEHQQSESVRQSLEKEATLLKKEIENVGTFSILNADDPINQLRTYGWDVWSDNRFSSLGYYVVMQHPKVASNREIIVCRKYDIEGLKLNRQYDWHQELRRWIREKLQPILALDSSYLNLYTNSAAKVGGVLYLEDKEIDFHEPLKDWHLKLPSIVHT